jgi:transposase
LWAAFWNHVASIVTDLDQLMFMDEAAKDNCTHCHTHGYSPAGIPCVECTVWVHNQCISVTPLLTLDGIIVYELFNGSVTLDQFIDSFINKWYGYLQKSKYISNAILL